MSQQIITRSERIKLFIREYYFGNNIWINTLRVIGGPLVIGCGIHLYPEQNRFAIGYGGFCFLYGIYYLLKPGLIIATRPNLFKSSTFDLLIDPEGIMLQEAGVTVTIKFASFKSILRRSEYYSVKLPEKMTVYFKANLLSAEEKSTLNKHLTA